MSVKQLLSTANRGLIKTDRILQHSVDISGALKILQQRPEL